MKWPEVRKLLQVTAVTLSRYVKEWKIRITQKFNWSRYIYNDEDVYNMIWKKSRKSVIYARVSTNKQSKDLENQIETIQSFMNKNWIAIWDIYSDISSWLNFERKNFMKMLEQIEDNEIKEVYITYKDRLSRIWFEMFEWLFKKHWCRIIVLNEIDNKKWYEEEIFWEISSLLHSFSTKMYSKRRQEKLNLISKDLKNYDINNERN